MNGYRLDLVVKFLEVHNAGIEHKQGYNAYEAIKNAISGHPDFIFE